MPPRADPSDEQNQGKIFNRISFGKLAEIYNTTISQLASCNVLIKSREKLARLCYGKTEWFRPFREDVPWRLTCWRWVYSHEDFLALRGTKESNESRTAQASTLDPICDSSSLPGLRVAAVSVFSVLRTCTRQVACVPCTPTGNITTIIIANHP